MQNLAILDDYIGASLKSADWDELKDDFNITVFNSHFSDPATLIERLKDFEVICAMRERTPFTAEVFEGLPNLELFVSGAACFLLFLGPPASTPINSTFFLL